MTQHKYPITLVIIYPESESRTRQIRWPIEPDALIEILPNLASKMIREHLIPRGITFDLKEVLRYKQNAKVRDLLVAAAKKEPFSAGITVSDLRSMVRNKFNYMVRESKGLTATSEESTRRSRVHAVSN
ncbi:hypothetical protein G6F26_013430 [Rhizopus arrhizus]|nr:hypothetical protein G6F26_013430 [Rhizopus arrhizus]